MGPPRHGLRPTLRQLLILVLFFALLFAALTPLLRDEPPGVRGLLVAMTLVVSPLGLGGLVRWLDRPGPVRDWLVSVAVLLPFLSFAVWWSWLETSRRLPWPLRMPHPYVSYATVAFFLGAFFKGAYDLRPARCPGCRRLTAIPAGPARWCASCGAASSLAQERPGQRPMSPPTDR